VKRFPSAVVAIVIVFALAGVGNALATRAARAATVFDNYNGLNCSCGFSDGFFAEEFSPGSDFDFTGAAASIQNAFREDHSFSMALYSATASGVPGSPLWMSGTVTVPPLASTLAFASYSGSPILLQTGVEYFLVLDLPTAINPLWIGDGLSAPLAFRSADGSSWSSIGDQDLQFEIFGAALGATAIPELAPWAMLLIGFALAGFVANRPALLVVFGSACDVARAGLADLEKTPGLNAVTAKLVYDSFRDAAGG
jgi:hypothetical protein